MQNNSLSIEVLLNQNEDIFSKKEKIIAQYILNNLDDLEKLDGKTIAASCNVGFSTLYNLFKKINIKSMKEFLAKVNQGNASRNLIDQNNLSTIQKIYLDVFTKNTQLITQESLYNFIDYLVEANIIYIIGIGKSHLAAVELGRRLNNVGFLSFVIDDETTQMASKAFLIKEKDLLISISMSGKTESIIAATKNAKKNGTKIITITEKTKTSLEKYSDFQINLFSSSLLENQNLSISPLTTFAFFVDSLINEISKIDFSKYYNFKTKIGIDIGGTNTRIAAISSNNKIIEILKTKTNTEDFQSTYQKICQFIDKFKNINLISLCVPGTIDFENEKITDTNNLKGWNNLAIIKYFKKDYPNLEIKIMNDARAAALGQYEKFKDLPNAKVLFFTTISTGIGSGLINDGKIFTGINRLAGETSHTMLDYHNCDLIPVQGIEYYCSGPGIMNNYPYHYSKNIQELFNSNNEKDLAYLDTVKLRLASYFATAIGFYNPGLIVVGGSVAENNPHFMEKVFAKTKEIIFPAAKEKLEFKLAQNTLESTLIGLVA